MSDDQQQAQEEFHFPPEYADCIAHVAANWSGLEYMVNASIWELADVRPSLGACLTSQIGSLNARLSALLALMKLRSVDQKLVTRVNKFCATVREPNELRNRIIHDQWVNDRHNLGSMGRIEIVAPKKLSREIKPIPLDELKGNLKTISDCRFKFGEIRQAIRAALPSLPEMSRTELYPITEILPDPQSPSSRQT